MSQRLFGLETEYAFALLDRQGRRVNQAQAIDWLVKAARQRLVHLPDINSNGIFLTNGSRLYIDCGAHPEYAGPELADPWDAARYIKAGELTLQDIAADLVSKHDGVAQACFFRQNVDYSGSGSTWGSHESYLHKASPELFQRHLLPYLATRLIYTGAGGFDPTYPGIRFLLSPRVPYLVAEVSGESTQCRGVLHTKNESLSSEGYNRLHLLCSESLFSEWAIFLRVGVTAVIVAMIEAGLRPGDLIKLSKPLEAMRLFAEDPSCRQVAAMARGEPNTAVTIQRRYLEMAQSHLGESFMPPWAAEVCTQWRRALDLLESGSPDSVASRLDWAIRWSVFSRFLQREGYSWESVQDWNRLIESPPKKLEGRKNPFEMLEIDGVIPPEAVLDYLLEGIGPRLREHGIPLNEVRKFQSLRSRLFELDTRFGQLGGAGLFSQLDQAGVLDHHLQGVDNFAHARDFPPALGRAKLRGDTVRLCGRTNASRNGYLCDWSAIWDMPQKRYLDLSDPFAQQTDWKTPPSPKSEPASRPSSIERHLRVLEMLHRDRRPPAPF